LSERVDVHCCDGGQLGGEYESEMRVATMYGGQ
jgi:hypothetical protein